MSATQTLRSGYRFDMLRLWHAQALMFYGRLRDTALVWERMLEEAQPVSQTEQQDDSAPALSAARLSDPPRAVRMAFLLSRYPAISHTFLLQEVAGLRARGFEIATASVNAPDRAHDALPPIEAAEAQTTFYVKRDKAAATRAILATAIAHPAVVLRGLRAVLRLPRLTLRARLQWLFYLAEALVIGRWMRREKLHHLHVHFGGPVASVGMLTSIAWSIPYSLTIHGPEELLNSDRFHLREKLQQAAFVFCISDFCRSQLCALTPPKSWTKYTVIRLGVDPARLEPTPSAANSQTLSLVCTGRLVPEKGQRILLETMLKLRQRGVRIALTLIGTGVEELSLRGFVTRHGLTDDVTFTGALAHSQTLERVRAAELFVLPSFAEGIPVALMEAMAFAVPCISTTIAGIPELIESGRHGLLVAPANVDALADAIATLADDAALRKYLGASARERIVRDYNLSLNHNALAAAFAERVGPAATKGARA